MKKLGFTLSEVIIALGIIGIIAAITTPLIGGIIPDKDKVQVLKYYKVINDITQTLVNDTGLYWQPAGVSYVCIGISCIQTPLLPKYSDPNKYFGSRKFQYLFADHLDLMEGPTISRDFKFKTKDGVSWKMSYLSGMGFEDGVLHSKHEETVVVDLNDTKAPNCFYSSSCKKPDQFRFKINKYGKVTGHDPLTKAYLENPHKLNDKKADYARAKELLAN